MEGVKGEDLEKLEKPMCAAHEKFMLNFYCEACKRFFCARCKTDHKKDHTGHDPIQLEAVEDLWNDTLNKLEKRMKIQEKVGKNIEMITKFLPLLETSVAKYIQNTIDEIMKNMPLFVKDEIAVFKDKLETLYTKNRIAEIFYKCNNMTFLDTDLIINKPRNPKEKLREAIKILIMRCDPEKSLPLESLVECSKIAVEAMKMDTEDNKSNENDQINIIVKELLNECKNSADTKVKKEKIDEAASICEIFHIRSLDSAKIFKEKAELVKRKDEKITLVKKAISILDEYRIENSETAYCYKQLGFLYYSENNKDATLYISKAITMYEKLNNICCDYIRGLMDYIFTCKDPISIEVCFNKLLGLKDNADVKNENEKLATVNEALGLASKHLGKEYLNYYINAADLYRKVDPNHSCLPAVCEILAQIYKSKNNIIDAQKYAKEACRIYAITREKDDVDINVLKGFYGI